jgi:predicted RNA-binding Zn ribbon-like protein
MRMNNEFIAGRACLDFANTVDWRTSDAPEELLQGYADLVTWSTRAGILEPALAAKLEREARAHPRAAARAFADALALRETIHRIFLAHAHGESPRPDDLAFLGRSYAEAVEHAALVPDGQMPAYGWSFGEANSLERPAWPLALSAVELLASGELAHVHECGGRGCGWLFLDETRNHGRRWCVSSSCGNRERVRRYYAKRSRGGRDRDRGQTPGI